MEEFPGKKGQVPEIRTVAMARDTNLNGDIFGGWVISQMDLAAGMTARRRANGRVATVAIEAMAFHAPVFIGDSVSCFTKILGMGRTSITIHVETWSERLLAGEAVKVTEGNFVMVALDDNHRPREVPPA
ncbi:MAG: acyl-CoA thioesterase [Alphaproteobacteria bacterium]|nr:acyl-CoA thioesterase [Alphaproteobacteria bacterium]